MRYKELIRLYENRKQKIEGAIADDELKKERSLQLQGAVDEIELFLVTLRQYQEKELKASCPTQDDRSQEKGGVFSRLSTAFKSRNVPTSRQFSLSEGVSE